MKYTNYILLVALLGTVSCGKKEYLCECKETGSGKITMQMHVEGTHRYAKSECDKYGDTPKIGLSSQNLCELK